MASVKVSCMIIEAITYVKMCATEIKHGRSNYKKRAGCELTCVLHHKLHQLLDLCIGGIRLRFGQHCADNLLDKGV